MTWATRLPFDFRNGAGPTKMVLTAERIVEYEDPFCLFGVGFQSGHEERQSKGAPVAG
jgi:hypothetical protein